MMYVIPPAGDLTTITEAMLTSSTIPEAPPTEYNGGTTYDDGDTASVAATGNAFDVYLSLEDSNTGHAPASSPAWWRLQGRTYGVYDGGETYDLADRVIDVTTHMQFESLAGSNIGNPLTDADKWLALGPTNRWGPLDLTTSTGATAPSPVTYVITPGKRVNAFGFAGMVADRFTVTVDDGSEIYSYTESLSTRVVLSWLDWLTKPFTFRAASSRNDLPLVSNGVVTITFERDNGDVTLGSLFLNRSHDLGEVETDPSDDAMNYSTFERNIEGTATAFIPRRVIPLINVTAFAPAAMAKEVRNVRVNLRNTPAYWVGLPDGAHDYFENVQTVGVWKGFRLTPGHPDLRIDLALEEA